ncbi:hypothetical protein P691DRAFT_812020 [Macrolepiota fuliginosa MF-IS2]|uniref:Uncharacterized protein n=1 Tax=Macrolepiota fuliginosa MF-IS2 TaxID=1400762 RepID=A0A9P5X1X9_9AGAR|nr:hypothetical protein P691DRAFT_812020 [Macrolepiota fuliginosa MF-IS2]
MARTRTKTLIFKTVRETITPGMTLSSIRPLQRTWGLYDNFLWNALIRIWNWLLWMLPLH